MDHYFTNNEKLKSDMKSMKVEIIDKEYIFYTDNGVFSKSELDFGTRFLIECLPLSSMSGKVLDLGCGYGPIGLVIARETECNVEMVDINLRALHLAKLNADKNKIEATIYESDAYTNIKGEYDYIVTNPPIRAGKHKVYEFLIGAFDFLKDNGQLWFVIRKDQGAKSTLKDIEKMYNVSIYSRKKGFFVICAVKKPKSVDIS